MEEWAVRVVRGVCMSARGRVRVGGRCGGEFEVGVGVHRGSVLGPLLFILVLEALSRGFRAGVPWGLLCADGLVVIADSLEECISGLWVWRAGMGSKGLGVSVRGTKFLVSGVGLGLLRDSGGFPCAVCRGGVGVNSVECSRCGLWVHRGCGGLAGGLVAGPVFVCQGCRGVACPIDGRPVAHVDVDGTRLDVEAAFCYLGDMFSAGGGCDHAIAARCCAAWGKFRKLLPIHFKAHLFQDTRQGVHSLCSVNYAPWQ